MATKSLTTARCLGLVSTAFIVPNGGKPNFGAKAIATLWYLLVLPDAQSRLHRQLHHKRIPWFAPSRIIGAALAAANIVTMPLSWALLAGGKRNASRLAALGVLVNPPSITLSMLIVTEISSALIKKSVRVVKGTGNLIAMPFKKKEDPAPSQATPAQSQPAPAQSQPAPAQNPSATEPKA